MGCVVELLTTSDAAEQLGISRRRINALIKSGKLPAVKAGRDWLIKPEDLEQVTKRKPGYPKGKPRTEEAQPPDS